MTIDAALLKQRLELLRMSGVDCLPAPPKPGPLPAASGGRENQTSISAKSDLINLRGEVVACVRCGELAKSRINVVFGAGNANAELVFVGEAPGRQEDEQGLPFVGEAGQLLTKIIESIGLKREQVFICNVLKCRPPGNRNPLPDEIMNCEPYLIRQLDMIRPKIICALGKFAAQSLLKTDRSISALRGQFHEYSGIPLMCTFHPAYLLRNPADKRKVWEDMKMVRDRLRELRADGN